MQTRVAVLQVTNDAEAEHMGPGVSQKGQPYDSWSQTGYLWTGSAFPVPVSIRFDVLRAKPDDKNFLPLTPGLYAVPGTAFRQRGADINVRFDAPPVPLAEAVAELQALLKSASPAASAPSLRAAS